MNYLVKSEKESPKRKEFKVMGTGSRSLLLAPDAKEVYMNLEQEILNLRSRYSLHVITGLAEGWDEAVAKVALRNNIPYTAFVPNRGYGSYYWGRNSLLQTNRMNTFNKLLDGANEVIYVCSSLYENGVHANFLRNQAMVDAADGALVYEPDSSGTKDAVRRLKAAGKPFKVAPFRS